MPNEFEIISLNIFFIYWSCNYGIDFIFGRYGLELWECSNPGLLLSSIATETFYVVHKRQSSTVIPTRFALVLLFHGTAPQLYLLAYIPTAWMPQGHFE